MNQLVHSDKNLTADTDSAKETGRTNDPARTMAEILQVATHEFADKGLTGARIDAIAAATRTSKRMIYYYFGSKEGLYIKVLEEAYRHIRAIEADLGRPIGVLLDLNKNPKRLKAFTNGMIEYFVRPMDGVRYRMSFEEMISYRKEEGMRFRTRPPGVVEGPLGSGSLDLPLACQRANTSSSASRVACACKPSSSQPKAICALAASDNAILARSTSMWIH